MSVECCAAGGTVTYYCALLAAPSIIVGALGLAGVISLQAASISALVVSPIGLIPGVLGLTGAASAHIVSGVVLGGGLFYFMISCCAGTCTSVGTLGASDRAVFS